MASGATSNPSAQRPPPLHACPSPPESLAFPTHWYRLPINDRFLICTKCYEEKLHSTPFARLLRCDYLDFGPGSVATCDFNTPRIDSLLREAVASNSFQPLCSFAEKRMSIKSCSGTEGIKGGNDVKWFKPINDDIPHFISCEACYEDVILGTQFESKFVPYPTNGTWSCDLAIPYLKRTLQRCSWRRDWHGFVQAGRHRLSLPTCVNGVPALVSAKRWYNTVRPSPIHNMTVCEACYLDRAGWREDCAQIFAPIEFSPYDVASRYTCDFQPAPMAACIDILLTHGVYEKWHYFASIIMSKSSCDREGIVDGEWYGLPDPTDNTRNIENFDICAACHTGWNQSADWVHLFRRLKYPLGRTRVCDLNPSSPRYSEYVAKWNQMYFTRDPTPFTDYVSRLAYLPKCQGTRSLENATWYGDKDANLLICPSCFEETVRGTHFASAFRLQNVLLPDAHHCSLYSQRMRSNYFEACKQKSLDSLLDFSRHRELIYQQTIPQLEIHHSIRRQQLELLKITARSRSSMQQITSLGRGFMGGNPIVTNFDPAVRLQTINYEHQRRNLQYGPERVVMMELEVKWKEVE